jgi:hypothetical protein
MHPCFVDKGDRDSRIDCRLLIVVESPDITLPPAVAKQSSTLDWESTINRLKSARLGSCSESESHD